MFCKNETAVRKRKTGNRSAADEGALSLVTAGASRRRQSKLADQKHHFRSSRGHRHNNHARDRLITKLFIYLIIRSEAKQSRNAEAQSDNACTAYTTTPTVVHTDRHWHSKWVIE